MFEGLGDEIIEAYRRCRVKQIREKIISAASKGLMVLDVECDFSDEELDSLSAEGISATRKRGVRAIYTLRWYCLV